MRFSFISWRCNFYGIEVNIKIVLVLLRSKHDLYSIYFCISNAIIWLRSLFHATFATKIWHKNSISIWYFVRKVAWDAGMIYYIKSSFYTIAPNQLRSIKCSTNAIPWHLYFARYNGISYDLIFILNTHEGRWDIKCRNE